MDNVEDLAGRTGQEVAEWRATLNNHTKLLKAIRDDHVDQGKHLTGLEAKVTRLEAKVDEKFEILHKGQKQITELLTRHLGEPDDETRADGAE